MCTSEITARKFAMLLGEVMFYRLTIELIFLCLGHAVFSYKRLLLCLIPIRVVSKGFTSAYLVFFLCIPFLNILLRHLNEQQHLYLLFLGGFVYVFLGTVPGFTITMNYVSWFCMVYCVAAYLRMYPKQIFDNTKILGLLTVFVVILDIAVLLLCLGLGKRLNMHIAYYQLTDCNKFLPLVTATLAFLFFHSMKIPYSNIINIIGASTFGVLLIHAHSNMRRWLWYDFLDNAGHFQSPFIIVHALGSVLIIFIAGIALDILRKYFVAKPLLQFWDAHYSKCQAKYEKYMKVLAKYCGVSMLKTDNSTH